MYSVAEPEILKGRRRAEHKVSAPPRCHSSQMHIMNGDHFGGERAGTAFALLKCLRTPKMHQIAGFCIYNLENFPG